MFLDIWKLGSSFPLPTRWPRAESKFWGRIFVDKRGQSFNKRGIVTVKESTSNDFEPYKPGGIYGNALSSNRANHADKTILTVAV